MILIFLFDLNVLIHSFKHKNERILSSSIFGLGAPNRGPVDFNRPPSQLSYNFDYDDAFADDALAVSTPFGSKPQDIEFDSPLSTDEEDGTRVSYMHGDFQISLQSGILGSWMSDSLIFRPTLSVKDAYTQVSSPYKDVDMDLCEYLVNDDNENCLRPQSEAEVNKTRHEALQELFTSLDLGLPISRTRSLDLELDRPQNGQPLQSPAHISPLKSKNLAAEREKHGGRNRRSTLRASDFPAPNCTASAVGGPRRTRSGTVVQGPTAPRRERSGTILARPPVLRPINATAAALSKNRDIEIDKTDGHNVTQGTDDVLMSSDDDELLLKGHWCDEDWLVAAPPSPELRSQSTRKNAARKRRYGLAKGLGTWGMKEHDEDDGMDDPLLLK
ncbi:hypothetical protein H0H81_006235 [Sphagnurus paluster]|uniref:Uncharacterized protein n=1 Tax=Sphagnurus paluster TaxID=117069 RepID=A0A9P7GWA3_9AGAR|nr:hypothetical protein H0H81_006235 [Sphagnurus paluster]